MVIAHLIFQIQTILLALLDGLSQKAGIAGFNEILVSAIVIVRCFLIVVC